MGSSELHSVQKSMNEREGTPAGKIPIPIPWLDDHCKQPHFALARQNIFF